MNLSCGMPIFFWERMLVNLLPTCGGVGRFHIRIQTNDWGGIYGRGPVRKKLTTPLFGLVLAHER
jgi:hypothetical protein